MNNFPHNNDNSGEILKINNADLSYEDDLYYYYEDKLFTGIAYSYFPDRTIRAEKYNKDGIPDGKSTGWYPN